MIYTNFSIFKNKFKKSENQPDYKMSAKQDDKFIEIGACWIKQSKDGTQYLSCKLSENPAPTLTEDQKKAIQIARDNEILAQKKREINADEVFSQF